MNEEEKKECESKNEECGKCDEYLNGWKRALADYDNLKKDLAKERTDIRRSTTQQMAFQLLPVLDHFDQAIKFQPEGLDGKALGWLQGILYVRTQLESVIHELGLEAFGEIGEAFDPHRHEAGGEREEEGVTSGNVIEIVQRGWKQNDRIIRPAKVIIAK